MDARPASATPVGWVYALYGFSGLLSLVYQVAWFRIFVDRFGSTSLTFALVLCNFIAGLGAGSLASRWLADGLAARFRALDRLRLYGAAELLVGAAVLLTPAAARIPADLLGFPYVLHDGVYQQGGAFQLLRVGVATGCVFLPCFFMGVTFPLLCHAFRHDARFPSSLYAWNTLGACSGVLLCQFALLPGLGHDRTLLAAAGANLLLGGFFLLRGRDPAAGREAPPRPPAPPDGNPASVNGVLLTCAVLSGLLAGALEGDVFRRIRFLGQATSAAMAFTSFWAILGIFAASAAVRALPRLRLLHIKLAFVAALLWYVAVWELRFPLHEQVVAWVTPPGVSPPPMDRTLILPLGLSQLLVYTGFFTFPPFLLISTLLPYVCNRLQSDGRHLGLAYGANTLAFCTGVVAFSWVAPSASVFFSLKLLWVLFALCAGLLLGIPESGRLAPWKPAAALLALALACVVVPREFDRRYAIPGTPAAVYPVRALRGSPAQTTYVAVGPDPFSLYLYFDNVSLSSTSRFGQVYMRLMAHFPLLAQPAPRQALLIGYGVGNTASAIAAHDTIERVDVVELHRNVVATAPEFASATGGVHADPRLHFVHDDGRSFLGVSDRRYDLVTSEPPPPLHEGVYRLYSREYYRQVLEHLTPGGMMSQWVPVWQMPPEAVDLVLATFVDAFPHALLFTGIEDEFIAVGSNAPIDLSVLEQRFGQMPRVTADLARLGIPGPLSLIARVVKGDAGLRRGWAGRPVISDQHNALAHLFADPRRAAAIPYDAAQVLAEIGAGGLSAATLAELREVLSEPGRLRRTVRGFPRSSLRAGSRAGLNPAPAGP